MVEKLPLLQDGTAWRTRRGTASIWVPSPVVLVVAVRGHGDGQLAAPILAAYETLSKRDKIHLLVDAHAMDNYDSTLRTELTNRFFPDRKRFGLLQVLLHSKLVAMGVSVANLALGGIVSTTADRSEFKTALDGCLFNNRVVGFSSNALDSVFPPREASG